MCRDGGASYDTVRSEQSAEPAGAYAAWLWPAGRLSHHTLSAQLSTPARLPTVSAGAAGLSPATGAAGLSPAAGAAGLSPATRAAGLSPAGAAGLSPATIWATGLSPAAG